MTMSPTKPRVTWMIPVLNGMPYLPMTLASIEQQTFKDFQVVIWDNGSTDGTVEEARKWIPSRLPGHVVTDHPLPLGLARAAMVQECDTEFCALIDADDVNYPDRLERQMNFMKANPDVAVLGTHTRRINAEGVDQGQFTSFPLTHPQIVQEMLINCPMAQPSVLLRRSVVIQVGNYRDFSPTHVEDYDLWLRIAAQGFRLANLPEDLVNYRVHEGSTTVKSSAAQRLNGEMIRRVSDAAPALYGCSTEVMELLRHKKHPRAIDPLRKIAGRLGDEQEIWRSPVFYRAVRQMIAKTDLRSRTIAAVKARGVMGLANECIAVLMDLARYIKQVIFRK